MRAVVPCLLLALLAPSVDAQATAEPVLVWEVAEMTPVVVPITGSLSFEAVVEVSCATGSPVSAQPWTIGVQATPGEGGDGLSVSVTPATFSVVVDPAACAVGEPLGRETVILRLAAAHEVPAGSEIPVRLTASEASTDQTAAATVIVPIGAFLRYQANSAQAVFMMPPNGNIDVPLTVTNLGNGELRLSLVSTDATSDDLHVQVPDGILVPAGEEKRFAVRAQASGANDLYENRAHKLFLEATAEWSEDRDVQGDPIQIAVIIQEKGSAAAPTPVPIWLLLAVLAVLQVARRRVAP